MTVAVPRASWRKPSRKGSVAAQVFMIVMTVLWVIPILFALYVAMYTFGRIFFEAMRVDVVGRKRRRHR